MQLTLIDVIQTMYFIVVSPYVLFGVKILPLDELLDDGGFLDAHFEVVVRHLHLRGTLAQDDFTEEVDMLDQDQRRRKGRSLEVFLKKGDLNERL